MTCPPRHRAGQLIQPASRARNEGEHGFALITVLLAMFIMTALTAVMVNNIVSSFNRTTRQIKVTNALTAADAGVTQLVYQLQQGTNWTTWPTSYSTASGTWYGWKTIGSGQYEAHVDTCTILSASRLSSSGCQSSTDLVVTVQGRYPSSGNGTQTIQAVLRDEAGGPAAFNYAMFADKGIQVHHHGDSYISPTIVTTSIHSNGFITLNYPAIYRVGTMESSGKITIADGGGSTPAGTVSSSYNWPYWISAGDSTNPPRCYPALQYPLGAVPTTGWGTYNSYWLVPNQVTSTSYNCSGGPVWSPHAVVVGNVLAGSVEVKSNGATQQPTNASYDGVHWSPEATGSTCGPTSQAGFTDPITGACIPDQSANIDAGTVKFDATGQTLTGPASGTNTVNVYTSSTANCGTQSNCSPTCTACNQGTSDTGGHIGGQVNLHNSTWAPPSIPFPSLNFSSVTLPVATTDQGGSSSACTSGSTCHIFSSGSNFLTWMETSANVYAASGTYSASVNPCPTSYCMTWLDSTKKYTTSKSSVAYVVLRGDYEITGNSALTLSESSLRSAFGTPSTAVTPTVLVAGALVNEGGNISLTASLTVVGPTMDPFNPLLADTSLPQGTHTVPGLLASGGTGTAITSTDYDTDSSYTSTSNYQSIYRNTVIVRGLVYTGSWSASTSSTTASDQHWHNADPKNAQVIVGAQIGGTLHDCSNFTFSYDPIIENLTGFGGSTAGGIYVVDWIQV